MKEVHGALIPVDSGVRLSAGDEPLQQRGIAHEETLHGLLGGPAWFHVSNHAAGTGLSKESSQNAVLSGTGARDVAKGASFTL
jgi:hypothetical protein